ncbi:MAG TPA: hypothetical protein VIO61_13750 [Anaerolineaceae bacterium]
MKDVTWKQRLSYWFDNYMARGTISLVLGLAAVSLVIILLISLLVTIFSVAPAGGEPITFFEAVWLSLMRTLDAGTMGGDEGWAFRGFMFAVTLGGIFIISSLIGVLTTGLESKMEELRKGRSMVIENNHTVIYGWSSQIFTIISELVIANENQPKSCIAILADKDKVEMEDEIRSKIGELGRTRVVCRTGSTIDLKDIGIVSPQTSKSIIVLSQDHENPDADVIKTLLALVNSADRRSTPYHIVAEIRNPHNVDVAKMIGKDEVEILLVGDLIARIIAQTCRQSGLSVVYTELLNFEGDEIYFKSEPGLTGKTFREVLNAYPTSAVIGLVHQGKTMLNPPMDTIMTGGDQVIAISKDDDTLSLSSDLNVQINQKAIQSIRPTIAPAERTLILSWNWRAPTIINELDRYSSSGSTVTILADFAEGKDEIIRCCNNLQNIQVDYLVGDPTDRLTLNKIKVYTYNHVILLSASDTGSPQEADAKTLITLLHLREIASQYGYRFSIVSEMMDIRNRMLAEITRADDFIVSDTLISLLLSQISENKLLNAVFTDIFDPEGSEIYLKPVTRYITLGEPVNFYTIIASAAQYGEVAFGYRIKSLSSDPARSYGVVINPDKAQQVNLRPEDQVIVLAED